MDRNISIRNCSKFFTCMVLAIGIATALEVVFERCEMVYVNPKYFSNVTLNVRRYSRNGSYNLNLGGKVLRALDKNVSIALILEEYLHNEYQPSFVQFKFATCDMLKFPYIDLGKRYNLKCPIKPGYVMLRNLTVLAANFPAVFPFEKGRVYVKFYITDTEETMALGYVYASFKGSRRSRHFAT
ncbi:uncharacterized protein LOC126965062 [Leptidea sinapis]|uniref:uncharacterized protein LOC126965062 n=1 Tax=Leptidea sinapis TaxID=189913 RepID=UPI0021C43DEE|nr:uncharacterized protein LOC126965062 [Leptidea sinapis]